MKKLSYRVVLKCNRHWKLILVWLSVYLHSVFKILLKWSVRFGEAFSSREYSVFIEYKSFVLKQILLTFTDFPFSKVLLYTFFYVGTST